LHKKGHKTVVYLFRGLDSTLGLVNAFADNNIISDSDRRRRER